MFLRRTNCGNCGRLFDTIWPSNVGIPDYCPRCENASENVKKVVAALEANLKLATSNEEKATIVNELKKFDKRRKGF